jgi:hypothetical protein
MSRYQIFRLFFSIRRQDLGVIGAAKLAVREAFKPIPF